MDHESLGTEQKPGLEYKMKPGTARALIRMGFLMTGDSVLHFIEDLEELLKYQRERFVFELNERHASEEKDGIKDMLEFIVTIIDAIRNEVGLGSIGSIDAVASVAAFQVLLHQKIQELVSKEEEFSKLSPVSESDADILKICAERRAVIVEQMRKTEEALRKRILIYLENFKETIDIHMKEIGKPGVLGQGQVTGALRLVLQKNEPEDDRPTKKARFERLEDAEAEMNATNRSFITPLWDYLPEVWGNWSAVDQGL